MLPSLLHRRLVRLLRDRRGATAIEYGLICVLIAVALITAFQSLAGNTNAKMEGVSTNVAAAVR